MQHVAAMWCLSSRCLKGAAASALQLMLQSAIPLRWPCVDNLEGCALGGKRCGNQCIFYNQQCCAGDPSVCDKDQVCRSSVCSKHGASWAS